MTVPGNPPRQTAVADVINKVEQDLLEHSDWLSVTTTRLKKVLASPKTSSDLRDWLLLASDSRAEPLSEAVQTRLKNTDRAAFFQAAEEELKAPKPGEEPKRSEDFLGSLALIGLQYVVLYYNSNQREFRGAYLRSNLLSPRKLEAVRSSLRVPYRRGAVTWMTSFVQFRGSEEEVATIHDAALDLRGRVAAEDLVFGNHSVCGFPLLGPASRSLGFFFVSHPVPGLFVDDGVPRIMREVRKKFSLDLGRAVEEDVIASFGAETLQQSEAWKERAPSRRLGDAPIMCLADDSPTGFLAGLRITRDRNPVEGVAGTNLLDCHVSEMPFINLIWWHLQLTSTFYELWSDQIPRHLQRYADLLNGRLPALGGTSLPRMAWIRERRSRQPAENTLAGVDLTRPYYPAGVLEKLDAWTVAEGANWLAWHERTMRDAPQPASATRFHQQIDAALKIYSGPSHADLVVPIIGPEGTSQRVVGWFRFNCDPPSIARDAFGRTPEPFERFHQLHELLEFFLPELDAGLGMLLSWTDDRLRGLKHEATSIPLFKQLIDAARTVADWTVAHLTDALTGKGREARAGFDIVRIVYTHLHQIVEHGLGSERLNAILEKTRQAIEALGDSLEQRVDSLPEIPVLTLWLQSARPVIGVKPQGADSSLAQLLERDPGLPQLLTYLSFFALSGKPSLSLDLRDRIQVHATQKEWHRIKDQCPEAGSVIDLGMPPDDANFKQCEVTSISTEGATTLTWKFEDGGLEQITLEWDWGPRSSRPFPAAVQPVTGKVSRRIGAVIAKNARVSVKSLPTSTNELIAIEDAFEGLTEEMQTDLHLLETALLPSEETPDSKRKCWKVVAVDEQEYLLMLVGNDQPSPIIGAFRDIALAYERGAHLAWVRGHEHSERESLAERLAAVSHGYTGPVGALRHEMTMAKTRWGAEKGLPAKTVLDGMKNFLDQASAIIRLGEAAIEFALMEPGQHVVSPVTGTDLSEYVRRVISAYQPRGSRSIDFREADPWQLARKTVRLDEQIFIHGLSKILDNAVRSAQKVTPESLPEPAAGVLIDLDIRTSAVRLAISNVCPAHETAKALETVRRGLLTGERDGTRPRGRGLGLPEARKSFQYLGIATEVRPGPPPFALTVELLIPIAQVTNGRRA